MPVDIQRKVETTVQSLLERQTAAMSSDVNDHLRSHSADHMNTLQPLKEWARDWEGRTKSIVQECLRTTPMPSSSNSSDQSCSNTESSSHLGQIPKILEVVTQLNLQWQAAGGVKPPDRPLSNSEPYDWEAVHKNLVQSLDQLSNGLFCVLKATT